MRKILLLFVVCFCIHTVNAENKKVKLGSTSNSSIAPYSVYRIPEVTIVNSESLTIDLFEISSYSYITIIYKDTCTPVYSDSYIDAYAMQVGLSHFNSGVYVLLLNIDGVEYIGEFTL